MHSLIYELKKHAEEENDLYESTINDQTMEHYGMDCVSELDETDMENAVRRLQIAYFDFLQIDTATKALRFTDLKKMMQPSFDLFHNTVTRLSEKTIEEFTKSDLENENSLRYLMHVLTDVAYMDKGGFYIYYEDYLMPINEFVRTYSDEHNDILKQTFYIGNVLDYHY